jgi:pyruvate dehydrogenase E2 component (dihydrolipoamide acetyltransferase)
MKAGNLLAWKRREGEPVTAGDVLAEIETDKATIEFESQEEGILAKILVPDGTQDVPVGTLIAVLAEDEEHVSALQRMDWNSATKPESTSVQRQRYALATEMQQQQQQASSGSTEADTSMTQQLEQESEPLPWRYGPAVATMLANHELPAALVQRLQPSGPRGHVLKGDLLRVLAAAKGSGAASTRRDSQSAAEVQRSSSSFVSSTPHGPGTGTAAEGSRVLPSREHQQVPTSSSPSPAAATPPTTTTQFRDIPLSQVRRVIAERLLESKQKAPHAYQSIVVNFEALLELRQTINMLAANSLQALRTPKLTVNDLLLRAVAIALREHRSLNTNAERVDLAFAVATPTGLITPIIHDADTKSVSVIAAESQDLVQRARQNKLKLHEFQGGSFSISNLGMVPAIARFTAIINPPQAGILAIGAPQRRLVPRAANLTSQSSVEPLDTERLRFATLTLSYDAGRVQRTASLAFLQDLQRLIESPSWLLV